MTKAERAIETVKYAFNLGDDSAKHIASQLAAAAEKPEQVLEVCEYIGTVAPVAAAYGWTVDCMCSRIGRVIRRGYSPRYACSLLRRHIVPLPLIRGLRKLQADCCAGTILEILHARNVLLTGAY